MPVRTSLNDKRGAADYLYITAFLIIRMDRKMKKILLAASAALVLAGCGEKGDFEKAINGTTTLYSTKVFQLRLTVATVLPDTVPVMKSLKDLLNKGCSLFHNR